jgi:hypothetical protein
MHDCCMPGSWRAQPPCIHHGILILQARNPSPVHCPSTVTRLPACGPSSLADHARRPLQRLATAAVHRPVLQHHLLEHGVGQLLVGPVGEVKLGLAGAGVLVVLVAARLLVVALAGLGACAGWGMP